VSETTTTSIQAMTPGEIDTVLSGLWYETQKYEGWLASILNTKEHPHRLPYRQRQDEEIADRYRAEIVRLRAEAAPYEAEYVRRGYWNRYFLVNNSNGHVHRGMDCTTCFPDTQYLWLPSVSGATEQEMVAEFGETACTVCFPSAPAYKGYGDGTSAFARYTQAEKDARAAEKAARAAAKAEKAITAPDGSPLRTAGRWADTLNTVVAARNALSGTVQDIVYYGEDADRVETIRRIEEALLHKGWTQAEIDKVKANARKKAGR
jgi:hypothetical protein